MNGDDEQDALFVHMQTADTIDACLIYQTHQFKKGLITCNVLSDNVFQSIHFNYR